MTANERAKYIYDESRKAGITHHGAIGLLGNLQGETSDFDPMSLETLYRNRFGLTDAEYTDRANKGLKVYNDKTFVFDSAGYGIAQWTWWDRKKGLLEFAQSLGKSVGDLAVQVQHMFKEMQTRYPKTWKVLTTTDDYREAVKICVNEYEKPANANQAIETRCGYAANFLKQYEDIPAVEERPAVDNSQTTEVADRLKVVNLALSQVGYKEKKSNSQLDDFDANAGTNNYTKYARDLDGIVGFYNGLKQGFAWCDMLIDWCFVECFGVARALELLCQKQGGSGAGCTYSMQYFQAKGQFIKRGQGKPEVGDQIFFGSGLSNSGHTGIVYAVDGTKVYTVEGNTNDSAGVISEGIAVLKKEYSLSHGSIIGYGRPKWNDGYTGNGSIEIKEKVETPKPVEKPKEEDTVILDTLKLGDKGPQVKSMQLLLIGNGYRCGIWGADGDFGAKTDAALKKFQKANGLAVDGLYGPKSQNKLIKG